VFSLYSAALAGFATGKNKIAFSAASQGAFFLPVPLG